MICWTPGKFYYIYIYILFIHLIICYSVDQSSSSNSQPDGYKLSIWNNKDLPRDKARIVALASKFLK
jgi:hypothetical protein